MVYRSFPSSIRSTVESSVSGKNNNERWFITVKRFICLMLGAILYLSLVACGSDDSPPFSVDWDKASDEWIETITLKELYPFALDAYAEVNEENETIGLYAVISPGLDDSVVLEYADAMIGLFNFYASQQDNSIESGSADSYGGLYDEYTLAIGIAPLGSADKEADWYVSHFIPKGSHMRQAPKIQ